MTWVVHVPLQFWKVSGGTRIRLIQRGSPGGGGFETDVHAFGDEPMRASSPFATCPAKLPVWVCTWSPIEYGVQAPYCTSSAVFGVPFGSPWQAPEPAVVSRSSPW